jgi:3D (Asp-Asp-Asp) domain-containing protein
MWLRSLPKRRLSAFGAAFIVLLGGVLWLFSPEQHRIELTDSTGASASFITTERTLSGALNQYGIALAEQDQVRPPLQTSLRGKEELRVQIRRAVPVTVLVDHKQFQRQTAAGTVEELLKELSIELGPQDLLSTERTDQIVPDMQIQVVRRSEQVRVVREELPFTTVRREDSTLTIGETKEIQAGSPGLKEVQIRTRYQDGKEVDSEVLSEQIVTPPMNQLVAYGTTGVVSRGGRSYRFVKEMVMEATGYTAGKESNPDGNGYTYTGMKAVRGIVAVDPRVIPLYTRVYVEGYGEAIAADIGGAIKGLKIDLCFDTVPEALQWGRRPAKVYILND